MKSVTTSFEDKLLEILRGMDLGVPCVGLMESAGLGLLKEQDLTSVQVRVFNFSQPNECDDFYKCEIEIRLNVEQAESANGGVFRDAHEKIALWLEHVMLGANCAELDTERAKANGLQRTGDDKDFDTSDDVWFAVWKLTISGKIK